MSPHKTSSILRRIHSFLWPKPHACPLQPGGRRKRNTVRGTDRQFGWRITSSATALVSKMERMPFLKSLYLLEVTRKRVMRMGWSWVQLCGINEVHSVSSSGNLIYKSWNGVYMLWPTCLLGRLALCWNEISKKVLISTLPFWCRVARVEGRDSRFLSGPSLKKGQIQPHINHFTLPSFPSAIVIEQTNGRRPVAGGNEKTFDNYRQRFFPRSPQAKGGDVWLPTGRTHTHTHTCNDTLAADADSHSRRTQWHNHQYFNNLCLHRMQQ